jgi:GntR family transcriptional regulator
MIEYSKNWAVRKSDKTPLVDQLVNNIRWSIFTGEIRFTEKLPPIRTLAQELGIGVNTVRRAYKKLEEQSLVVTRPHIGTVVQMEDVDLQNIRSELVTTIKSALHHGLPAEDIRLTVDNTLKEHLRSSKRRIIFVYEDPIVGHRHAEQIAREADVLVHEVPLNKLLKTIEEYERIEDLDAIVTTYFTYAKVKRLCPRFKSIICGMTVEISKEVIGVLNSLGKGERITLICRKDESAEGFINLINCSYPHLVVEI